MGILRFIGNLPASVGLVVIIAVLVICMPLLGNKKTQAGVSDSPQVQARASTGTTNYYKTLASQDAEDAGIDPIVFISQITDESNWNPQARGRSGEIGIAQMLPSVAAKLGVDPADPVAALKAAAGLMGSYYRHFGGYAQALAAYNCGYACTSDAIAQGGTQRWQAFIPATTRQYIRVILHQGGK